MFTTQRQQFRQKCSLRWLDLVRAALKSGPKLVLQTLLVGRAKVATVFPMVSKKQKVQIQSARISHFRCDTKLNCVLNNKFMISAVALSKRDAERRQTDRNKGGAERKRAVLWINIHKQIVFIASCDYNIMRYSLILLYFFFSKLKRLNN